MIFRRLRDIREEKEFTQDTIANSLNIKRSAYSLWELGINTIPLDKLNNLCNFYDYSMDYILELSNIKNYSIINNNIDIQILSKRLKEIRLKENKTQEDIAKLLNTTHSTWSAYENGKVIIPTIFIYSFAKEFKCSIDWLCGRID